METEALISSITQIGVIPALFAYTLIQVKKSLDANTVILTKLYVKLGGEADE